MVGGTNIPMKKLLLLVGLVFLLFSNLVWARPGDTYHCKKEYGQHVGYTTNINSEDWGSNEFHFKWSLENIITFTNKELQTLKIDNYISVQGELFSASILDGYIYSSFLDGLFTYNQTSNGKFG